MSLKLHLGCGEIRLPGWVNIDVRPTGATDLVADLAGLTPGMFGEPIAAIYACHVLEHFGFGVAQPEAGEVLDEWTGLLARGGEIFISVPDMQRIGAALAAAQTYREQWNFIKCIYGGCEYPQNRHFIGFTRQILGDLFRRLGLVDVTEFSPFADDTSRFVLEGCAVSLNLKGRRP